MNYWLQQPEVLLDLMVNGRRSKVRRESGAAAFGGDLAAGQLLSPRALTSWHRAPPAPPWPGRSDRPVWPGEGSPLPRHPHPTPQAAASAGAGGQASCSS
jgi:hypothetical protein